MLQTADAIPDAHLPILGPEGEVGEQGEVGVRRIGRDQGCLLKILLNNFFFF